MQLSDLRPLYARPGPWASVYLDASRDTEDAAAAVDLRWRALREELEHQRTEPDTVAALDDVVRRHEPGVGDYGLAAFATGGRVVHTEYLSAPPRRDLAAHGPIPHAMPLVAQRGEQIPWVRVLASRTGADLDSVCVGEVPRKAQVEGGSRYPITRVRAGGWAQARFQREAMTSWKRNADDSAAATADLADRVGAEVVVVAGDPQARSMLAAQLPERWQDRVVQIDAGSRAWGPRPRRWTTSPSRPSPRWPTSTWRPRWTGSEPNGTWAPACRPWSPRCSATRSTRCSSWTTPRRSSGSGSGRTRPRSPPTRDSSPSWR
ncbi:hypothetical protein GCM10027605_40700 [Micromonospora zhanjiangensis]